MCIKREKKTTHGEIGGEKHTSSYINKIMSTMYVNKWSQDQYT